MALKESTLKRSRIYPKMSCIKNIAITFLLLHTAAELWLPAQTAAFTAFAVGFILLAKLRELHHHELLRKHYVRTYYFLQLFAAIGYLWIGINKLIDEPTARSVTHGDTRRDSRQYDDDLAHCGIMA